MIYLLLTKYFFLGRRNLERVLLIAKGSVEETKRRIERLLTARGMIPELCLNKTLEEFEDIWDAVNYVPLPKLNPTDRTRVMVTQFSEQHMDKFTILSYLRYNFLVGEYRINFDYTPAERFILDLKNVHIGHLSKLNPIVMKKAEVLCSEGIGTKIKGIHILNAPAYIDKFVYLLKQALREKVANRVHVHDTYEDLHKHIPKEILPKDFGGDEMSCDKLNDSRLIIIISHIKSTAENRSAPKISRGTCRKRPASNMFLRHFQADTGLKIRHLGRSGNRTRDLRAEVVLRTQ
ncbi:hypothetical protein O3G_MSEX010226 [Manduca sexta]|uniref:CRAL-TRIO domain-containing protein n=1 Tax=Manduca sexta TaxID=7130 RepID=A0A922CTH9_MANSE|nr:hypothetical protein O3G_MSEX010226 [Manduca sexta]